MTEHPSPTSEEAANLLRQVETTLTHTRGDTGWPTITAQTSAGAATSAYPLASRDTQFDAASFIGMVVWVLAPLILVVVLAKAAENGSGIRWGVYMAVRALCWSTSMFFPATTIRVSLTAVIVVASFVGALVEVHQ